MLPIQTRSHRTSIPATGLGSILVASPQLALAGVDRGVVAEVAVAVGMGEASFTAADRAPWTDATGATADDVVRTTADGTATIALGDTRGAAETREAAAATADDATTPMEAIR